MYGKTQTNIETNSRWCISKGSSHPNFVVAAFALLVYYFSKAFKAHFESLWS